MNTVVNKLNAGARFWWGFIITGILLIIVGIVIFIKPAEAYLGLSFLFSMVIIISGFSKIYFATVNGDNLEGWGWTLFSGIIETIIGSSLLIFSFVTPASLPFILGFWILLRSLYMIGTSIDLKKLDINGWGWIFTGGILDLMLGFLVLYHPATGVISIILTSGLAFITGGIFHLILAVKFRKFKNSLENIK